MTLTSLRPVLCSDKPGQRFVEQCPVLRWLGRCKGCLLKTCFAEYATKLMDTLSLFRKDCFTPTYPAVAGLKRSVVEQAP